MAQNKQIELPNKQRFAESLHKFYFALTMAETFLDETNEELKKAGLFMHEEKRDLNKGAKLIRSVLNRLHRMYLKEADNQLAFAEKSDFLEELFNAAVHIEREKDRERIIEFVERIKICKANF